MKARFKPWFDVSICLEGVLYDDDSRAGLFFLVGEYDTGPRQPNYEKKARLRHGEKRSKEDPRLEEKLSREGE